MIVGKSVMHRLKSGPRNNNCLPLPVIDTTSTLWLIRLITIVLKFQKQSLFMYAIFSFIDSSIVITSLPMIQE